MGIPQCLIFMGRLFLDHCLYYPESLTVNKHWRFTVDVTGQCIQKTNCWEFGYYVAPCSRFSCVELLQIQADGAVA